MLVISTIEELDEKIKECDAARSDAELRDVFTRFSMAPIIAAGDPFSPEYRQAQMALYEGVAGKTYAVTNEMTPFDVDAAVLRPFPYVTDSSSVVGNQLMSIGALLRRLQVPLGGRILEFGPGWGNTTLAMAMSGYKVTAVDIEPRYCDLIKRRAAHNGVDIEVINSDFMWAEQVTVPYDAVVFFECFHHCDDHMRLLRALRNAVKDEGRIYFGGEPITEGFPIPWGLRLDGESLWAIRKNGWLELGFTESYFVEALARSGWAVTKHESHDFFGSNVWEAVKTDPKVVEIPNPEVLALRAEVDQQRARITAQDAQLSEQALQIAGIAEVAANRQALIEAFRNSTSWRITAPLRAIVKLLRR
ncbi:class I SAM-dependent methyltransferase [Paraburkholderia sp. BR10872]|uniref:class I SAM-dependent methyltransferase n=1 Tax=Paraburkholderia sp. BR10872 TaxID=3236989 RepID=UPI0034D1BD1E